MQDLSCSNFTAAQIVESQWAAERIGGTPFISLQPQYSLLAREIEAEILPTCDRHGLGTLVYGPLGGGVLTGRYRRDANPEPDTRMGKLMAMDVPMARRWADDLLSERGFDVADEVGKVASELDTTPTAVALAWIIGRPGVTSAIIGPRTLVQYQQNMTGFDLDLPDELASRLNEASQPTNEPVTGQRSHR